MGLITDDDRRGCEYCDDYLDDDGDCPTCKVEHDKQAAYWAGVFARESHYTEAELRDCYSDPTDYHKLTTMLREGGYGQ